MTELLTAAQMRAVEAAAIASGAVTGLELMERAGAGVVAAIFEEWPELRTTSHRAVVLCGPGGNGGDGFVVARVLREWGWEVEVFLYGEPSRMPPDARVNYERWVGMGQVRAATEFDPWGKERDLFVDAVFGMGLTRRTDGAVKPVLDLICAGVSIMRRSVAVDFPSGLCSDSGRSLGRVPAVDLTVALSSQKWGHFLAEGPELCGRVTCQPIGLGADAPFKVLGRPADAVNRIRADYSAVVTLSDSRTVQPGFSGKRSRLDKGWDGIEGHKYTHGHALILSGGVGHGGAARLAARGALRIGAGVITLGVPPAALIENAAQVTAIMLARVKDAAGLETVLGDARINALCLGPGLGVDRAAGLLGVALARGLGVVLDADALTALSRDVGLFGALHGASVLTPHGGEFARLFPDIAARLAEPANSGPAYSKVDATREAAKRAGCVVLFKGPDTVIADPSGRCAINSAAYDRAAPWLATAGSGDVLAGFITGLLARGFAPFEAACTGAWLHVECALSFGPGLIAEDLPEELPKVFRALGM